MLVTAWACWSVCYRCKHLRPEVNVVRTGSRERKKKSQRIFIITKFIWQHDSMRRRIAALCQNIPESFSKKFFFFVFKNTLFYMLHARRIHIKSHIVHHTIYKFGEKEDRYKKSRYSRTSQPREEVVRFGRHAPRSDACRCYHGAVCLSVPADVGSSVQVAINCMLKRDLHAYHSILRERRHLQERSGTGPVYKQPSLDLKIKQEVFK